LSVVIGLSFVRGWIRRQGLLKRAVIPDLRLQGIRRLAHRLDLRKHLAQVLLQHPAAAWRRRVPSAT